MSAVLAPREPDLAAILGEQQWRDPWWRLNNLYWIVDDQARAVPFVPNEEQAEYYHNQHSRNLILKARKIGFSTFELLVNLDQALFNANFTGVVIADTRENGGNLFQALEFAYDHLPDALKEALPLTSRESKSRLEFKHGSKVVVTTSARGGTPQNLHVSEMGKIGAREPAKALEIVTGSFAAVPIDTGRIAVESTAEGASGEFFDLVMDALKRQQEGRPETKLDFRLHFFPWWRKKANRLSPEDTAQVIVTDTWARYFRELHTKIPVVLDAGQQAWYVKTAESLKRKMKREHPSLPEEAFEVAIEGAIYAEEMAFIRESGRILDIPIDRTHAVNTFWDFGASKNSASGNATAIWLHQYVGLQNRFVGYMQDSNRGLAHYKKWLYEWGERNRIEWGTDYYPHDADSVMLGEDTTTKTQQLTDTSKPYPRKRFVVVPRVHDLEVGLDIVREEMVRDCYFDRVACAEGIKCIDNYQYVWEPNRGVWTGEPRHNWASDGADAFRQWAQGFTRPSGRTRRPERRNRNWKTA